MYACAHTHTSIFLCTQFYLITVIIKALLLMMMMTMSLMEYVVQHACFGNFVALSAFYLVLTPVSCKRRVKEGDGKGERERRERKRE